MMVCRSSSCHHDTTALIQPMIQGVIQAFKAFCTRTPIEAVDKDQDHFTLKMYRRIFRIASCLRNVQQPLADMNPQTLNSSWKKLWPQIVNDCAGFTPHEEHHLVVAEVVKLTRLLSKDGFDDTTSDNVNGLTECHLGLLTDEDLVEMTKSASEEEDDEDS